MSDDVGVFDPWVAAWIEQNPADAFDDFSPAGLALARGPFAFPVTREFAHVSDETVGGVPVRIYQGEAPPTGLIVYFHGGGWCIGSIGIMDNVARELAHATGATVVSVGYRLAPEHPYPAGLDDCEQVTRWALENAGRFGVPAARVMVAGESAGGNLAAAITLRLRNTGAVDLAGQILIYPVLDFDDSAYPSRREFAGVVVSVAAHEFFMASYPGGSDLSHDPYAAPMQAESVADLPPALVITGGCDFLRDEGLAYVDRLRTAGVDTESVCSPGQPHGFMNFMFPAAEAAYQRIGEWAHAQFAARA